MDLTLSVLRKIPKLLIGVIGGISIGILLSFLCAVIFTFTPIDENFIPLLTVITVAVSAFFCGFIALFAVGNAGLINGLLSGILFLFFLTVVSFILFEPTFSANRIIIGIVCLFFSSVGGVCAVNIR